MSLVIGTTAGEFADALLVCLCANLADSIGGPVCQCSRRPGAAPPPADICCRCEGGTGQASVQVGPIFPVTPGRFPARGLAGQMTSCSMFEWAAELTMVVYRCVSTADEDGFPSEQEMTDDAAKIASDADAMWRAMMCCPAWRGEDELGDPAQIMPGDWRPIDPQGGCSGGQLTVIVNLGSLCCLPPG